MEEVKRIRPLMGYDKKSKTYYGDQEVIHLIERFTELFGITNFELYALTLKAYNRDKDIYHMYGNRSLLLLFKIVGLVNDCYLKTNLYDKAFLKSKTTDIATNLIPNTFITSIVEQSMEISPFFNIYPALPKEIVRHYYSILIKLKGLINIQNKQRSSIDMESAFVNPGLKNLLLSFYKDWEYNSSKPSKWANEFLLTMYNQDYGNNEVIAHDIIKKHMENVKDIELTLNIPIRLIRWKSKLYRFLDFLKL